MYHGLSAYNRTNRVHDIIRRAEKLPEIVACWADRPIGPVGVYCCIAHAEKVQYIADRDVYSKVDDGKRVIDWTSFTAEADIWDVSENDDVVELYNLYREKAELTSVRQKYIEIGACAAPAAVWVNKKYGARWVKVARVLARRLGLCTITIK